jgi:hypothetical protein
MAVVPELDALPAVEPYVVLTAWHCDTCEVQGRSQETDVACWNCGGRQVVVTARPSVRLTDA